MNTTAGLLQLTDGNRNSSCVLEKLSPEFMRVIQSSCRFIRFLERFWRTTPCSILE